MVFHRSSESHSKFVGWMAFDNHWVSSCCMAFYQEYTWLRLISSGEITNNKNKKKQRESWNKPVWWITYWSPSRVWLGVHLDVASYANCLDDLPGHLHRPNSSSVDGSASNRVGLRLLVLGECRHRWLVSHQKLCSEPGGQLVCSGFGLVVDVLWVLTSNCGEYIK